jgi:hypothetical protein
MFLTNSGKIQGLVINELTYQPPLRCLENTVCSFLCPAKTQYHCKNFTTPSGVFLINKCVRWDSWSSDKTLNTWLLSYILQHPLVCILMLYECCNAVLIVVCVFLMFLALPCLVKKQQNNVIHSYITLWCVLNAVCVLCNAGKETGDQWKTFLQHPLVCFEYRVCSLHCMVKKQLTSLTHSYITLWCVLNIVCVPCTAW